VINKAPRCGAPATLRRWQRRHEPTHHRAPSQRCPIATQPVTITARHECHRRHPRSRPPGSFSKRDARVARMSGFDEQPACTSALPSWSPSDRDPESRSPTTLARTGSRADRGTCSSRESPATTPPLTRQCWPMWCGRRPPGSWARRLLIALLSIALGSKLVLRRRFDADAITPRLRPPTGRHLVRHAHKSAVCSDHTVGHRFGG
jgi:hypothetical protein